MSTDHVKNINQFLSILMFFLLKMTDWRFQSIYLTFSSFRRWNQLLAVFWMQSRVFKFGRVAKAFEWTWKHRATKRCCSNSWLSWRRPRRPVVFTAQVKQKNQSHFTTKRGKIKTQMSHLSPHFWSTIFVAEACCFA